MTETKWAELTGKQQWDVQVALRGPDCQYSEPIKWLTTSVIRWACHDIMRVGGTLNEDLKCVVVPQDPYLLDCRIKEATTALPKLLYWSPSHFFQHVGEAAEVLGIPVYTAYNDLYIEAIMSGPAPNCVAMLWKSSPKGSPIQDELGRHLLTQFGIDTPGKYTPVSKHKKFYFHDVPVSSHAQSTQPPPPPQEDTE